MENRGSKNDEMSRKVWEAVETRAEKTRIAETKRRKNKMRRKEAEERRGEEKKKKKPKRERTVKVKRVVEEWEIWDEEKKTVKLEEEAKKLVLECFHW